MMRKVVLFKSASKDYQKAFNDNNFEVIFVEPLQFTYVNNKELSEKLLQRNYDGIIFTSPRAIEAASKCWDPSRFVIWNTKKVYTVGVTSSHKIKLLLGLESLGTTSGNAENLAKIIISDSEDKSKFLFPCGNLRSETIPDLLGLSQISLDSLTVYESKENEALRKDLIEVNESGNPCCMVFFSPSGCEYIYRQLQTFSNRLSALPHFAIGNSTAHKIENLGIEVAGVAAKPAPDSLVQSVQQFFMNTPTS